MHARTIAGILATWVLFACSSQQPAARSRAVREGPGDTELQKDAASAPRRDAAVLSPERPTIATPDPDADEDASTAMPCATAQYAAKLRPLDMLVLLDQSGSMTEHEDRWTPTTQAIERFVSSPGSAGIGIGLQYFPLGQDNDEKCDGLTYAQPAVAIAALPANAQAIKASIDAHHFTKANCCDAPEHQGTPTRPAIEGVLQYLRSWLSRNPERDAVVLLATDGAPSGACDDNDIDDVSRLMSEAALAGPSLKSYVIGIGDDDDLEQLAQAGGTGEDAFVIDGTGEETELQLLETLAKIRGESLRCDFAFPSGIDSDPSLTNVETRSATRGASQLVKVTGPDDCPRASQGGWYEDSARQHIQLCPDVCQRIQTEPTAQVSIVVGCATILL